MYLTGYLEKALVGLEEVMVRNVSETESVVVPKFSLEFLEYLRELEMRDRSNFLSTTPGMFILTLTTEILSSNDVLCQKIPNTLSIIYPTPK